MVQQCYFRDGTNEACGMKQLAKVTRLLAELGRESRSPGSGVSSWKYVSYSACSVSWDPSLWLWPGSPHGAAKVGLDLDGTWGGGGRPRARARQGAPWTG